MERFSVPAPAAREKSLVLRSDPQRFLNIDTRCVDVLHRPQARGAFAAAIYALQRQHGPSLRQVDINKADARKTGRHDARGTRAHYHDGAEHSRERRGRKKGFRVVDVKNGGRSERPK